MSTYRLRRLRGSLTPCALRAGRSLVHFLRGAACLPFAARRFPFIARCLPFIAACLTFTTHASAEKPVRDLTVTLAPLNFITLTVEVAAEVRLPRNFSMAGVYALRLDDARAVDVGVQGRYYVVGGFEHGVSLLTEVRYQRSEVQTFLSGFYVGYKIAFDVGFTFDTALGIWTEVSQEELILETPDSGPRGVDFYAKPFLKLNVGWTF